MKLGRRQREQLAAQFPGDEQNWKSLLLSDGLTSSLVTLLKIDDAGVLISRNRKRTVQAIRDLKNNPRKERIIERLYSREEFKENKEKILSNLDKLLNAEIATEPATVEQAFTGTLVSVHKDVENFNEMREDFEGKLFSESGLDYTRKLDASDFPDDRTILVEGKFEPIRNMIREKYLDVFKNRLLAVERIEDGKVIMTKEKPRYEVSFPDSMSVRDLQNLLSAYREVRGEVTGLMPSSKDGNYGRRPFESGLIQSRRVVVSPILLEFLEQGGRGDWFGATIRNLDQTISPEKKVKKDLRLDIKRGLANRADISEIYKVPLGTIRDIIVSELGEESLDGIYERGQEGERGQLRGGPKNARINKIIDDLIKDGEVNLNKAKENIDALKDLEKNLSEAELNFIKKIYEDELDDFISDDVKLRMRLTKKADEFHYIFSTFNHLIFVTTKNVGKIYAVADSYKLDVIDELPEKLTIQAKEIKTDEAGKDRKRAYTKFNKMRSEETDVLKQIIKDSGRNFTTFSEENPSMESGLLNLRLDIEEEPFFGHLYNLLQNRSADDILDEVKSLGKISSIGSLDADALLQVILQLIHNSPTVDLRNDLKRFEKEPKEETSKIIEKKIKDNIDEVIDAIYGLFRTKLEKTLNEKETSKAKIVIDALKKKGLDIVEVV